MYNVFMNIIESYAPYVLSLFTEVDSGTTPWELIDRLPEIMRRTVVALGAEYEERDGSFIHRSANVHPTAILQDSVIVSANASIGPHAMLRGGVLVGEGAHIGGSSEIKQSIIGPGSAAAHLNYVGNSIVGSDVNMEAGSVLANHYNERKNKTIDVLIDGQVVKTGVTKFGALIGDGSRIGANAVTSPGTILAPKTVVARLELVQQLQ